MNVFANKLVTGISTLALAAAFTMVLPVVTPSETGGMAFASEDGEDSHGGGGKGGGGKGGNHSDEEHTDHDHTDDTDTDEEHGGGGKGGGHDGATEGQQGPRAGDGQGGERDRPVWAKEGIPSNVELGRMNVARSPDKVLDQAAAEALKVIQANPEMIAFYSMPLDEMGDLLEEQFGDVPMIDSPVSNLGLLKESLGGRSVLIDEGVKATPEELSAVFLGTASDKNISITPEVAYSVSKILGYELTEDQARKLAEEAEAIRASILEGHG